MSTTYYVGEQIKRIDNMVNKKKPAKGELKRAVIIRLSRDILVAEGCEAFVLRDIAKRAAMKLGN
jgi:hypothetical protein